MAALGSEVNVWTATEELPSPAPRGADRPTRKAQDVGRGHVEHGAKGQTSGPTGTRQCAQCDPLLFRAERRPGGACWAVAEPVRATGVQRKWPGSNKQVSQKGADWLGREGHEGGVCPRSEGEAGRRGCARACTKTKGSTTAAGATS